jgi:hypothetical protein
MQIQLDKVGGVPKIFPANHRRGSDYTATIQNLTGAVINLTYTNSPIQETDPSPVFGVLTGQPATVAAGALECVTCPITGIKFTGVGDGKINIVEAG